MVMFVFRHVGLHFVVLYCLGKSTGSNVSEKTAKDSFVVSANYGVQSESTQQASVANPESSDRFKPNSFQQSQRQPENSLVVNHNYHESFNTQGYQEDSRNSNRNYQNTDVIPNPSEWHANFIANPYSNYQEHPQSHSALPQSYHASYMMQSESSTTSKPYQESQESYLKATLRNEVVKPTKTVFYNSYSSKFGRNIPNNQNDDSQVQATKQDDIIYGSNNNRNHKVTRASINGKVSSDNTYESPNPWLNRLNENDFQKPNVLELQEMVKKIVNRNTKVHQVLKVPAVYEIHLQEEEKPSDQHDMNSFQVPTPQWSTQNVGYWGYKPYEESFPNQFPPKPGNAQWENYIRPQQEWPKRRPHKSGTWKHSQYPPEPQHSTKTWNFNNNGVNGTPFPGKYTNPKLHSFNNQLVTDNETPLQQSYNSQGSGPEHFNRMVPTVAPMYGSVNVPMTPGTTEVTFRDYSANSGYHNNIYNVVRDSTHIKSQEVLPDLNNYYAKKKEIDNSNNNFIKSYGYKNAYRRDGNSEPHGRKFMKNLRRERHYLPLDLNYIIHVREKSRS